MTCCVPFCKSRIRNKKGSRVVKDGEYISFHEFPSDLTLREEWIKAISCKAFFVVVVNDCSNSTRICSKHFKKEDFVITNSIKRRLKPRSIPSIFDVPAPSKETIKREIHFSQVMEAPENYLEMTIKEEPSSEPECIVPTMQIANIQTSSGHHTTSIPLEEELRILQQEIRRKEYAIEAKSKLLKVRNLEVRKLKRQLRNQSKQLQNIPTKIESLEKDLAYYSDNIYHKTLKKLLDMKNAGCIEPKQALLLTHLKYMFNKSFRWPKSVLEECAKIQAVCPEYSTISEQRTLVDLPSTPTIMRYINSVTNETEVLLPSNLKLQKEVTSGEEDVFSDS